MQVTIKANDTFHDSRVHGGGLGGVIHAGQTAVAPLDTAQELEKAGLVEIISEKVKPNPPVQEPETPAPETEAPAQEPEAKDVQVPENKMQPDTKRNRKNK